MYNKNNNTLYYTITGPEGDKGLVGPMGSDGKDGRDGRDGRDGLDGLDGKNGKSGRNGKNGKNGLDNNEKGITGNTGLKGPCGDIGEIGDKGLQGDKGITGPKGPTGDRGEQGSQGMPGLIRGITGNTGSTGLDGPQGLQGPSNNNKGDTGPIGIIGSTGPRGEKGERGIIGKKGWTGETGPTGISIKGDIGPDGPKGKTGLTGITGIRGDTGEVGPVGCTGLSGGNPDLISYYYSGGFNRISSTIKNKTPTAGKNIKDILNNSEIINIWLNPYNLNQTWDVQNKISLATAEYICDGSNTNDVNTSSIIPSKLLPNNSKLVLTNINIMVRAWKNSNYIVLDPNKDLIEIKLWSYCDIDNTTGLPKIQDIDSSLGTFCSNSIIFTPSSINWCSESKIINRKNSNNNIIPFEIETNSSNIRSLALQCKISSSSIINEISGLRDGDAEWIHIIVGIKGKLL